MRDEMFSTYPRADGRYDEMFVAPGQARPHWDQLLEELTGAARGDLRLRQAAAQRQIEESGVTYNVYADPQGIDRPWDLDVLPLVIPPQEWAELEAGIAQRADLLNRILVDLYGSQSLLRDGLIPPGLVFSQSGYLRPAHGMQLPGNVHLHLYAADLARSPDGRWWVMADRTQNPSGVGYALENRLVVSRIFPGAFRDMGVQHLARFFATFRDSLMHFAPRGDGQPLTVLLTPGPYNETYFEHTLLARYLGFPLVEGGDLTVREGKVWLKTLSGLRRVHAILRRQDDTFCDPLELRTDSALGVAGLTDCVRRGTVLMANGLGSGVLESGTLMGFLPRLSEHLLGESLRMPSIATWWCGEPAAREDALNHVDRLVFKSADPSHAFNPIFGQDLDDEGLEKLKHRLQAHPDRFVAQELVQLSQAPVLGRAPQPRVGAAAIGLRVYAVATPRGYVVMPGGLTRVASGTDTRVVAMQRGGGSKDTWILSEGPVDGVFTLLQNTVTASDLVRSGVSTPSRVAENLFWFGRFQERCDDTARLLREALNPSLQEDEDEANDSRPVLALARSFGILDKEEGGEALLKAATMADAPFGLVSNLNALERLAYTLRDRVSLDHSRTLNGLLKDPVVDCEGADLTETLAWLDRTVSSLTTLSGFVLDGMTRDEGWRFLSIGRRLERLSFQCLALLTAMNGNLDAGLSWLLRLGDSVVTYHSRYMARPEWLPVLDLLVADASNPRSLIFQANGIDNYLEKLRDAHGCCDACEPFSEIVAALHHLGPEDLRPESLRLRRVLEGLRYESYVLSDSLAQRFFNHARGMMTSPMRQEAA